MVLIAVAGGTSPHLGQAIVCAILKTTNKAVILTRQKPPSSSSSTTATTSTTQTTTTQTSQAATTTTAPGSGEPTATTSSTTATTTSTSSTNEQPTLYGAPLRAVDYASPAALAAALAGVHTLVSVLAVGPAGTPEAQVQLALVRAARAAGVKRFVPSEWGFGGAARVDVTAAKEDVWRACGESGGMECARLNCGWFMNYLAINRELAPRSAGGPYRWQGGDEARAKALAGLRDNPILFDFKRGVAELPVKDDGTFPRVTFTEIDDVGRFVAAACLLTEGTWSEEMGMVGETVALDEVVLRVKDLLGIELVIKKVTREELEGRVRETDGKGVEDREAVFKRMVAQFMLVILEEREGWSIIRPTLNEICFHVKPLSISDYLRDYR